MNKIDKIMANNIKRKRNEIIQEMGTGLKAVEYIIKELERGVNFKDIDTSWLQEKYINEMYNHNFDIDTVYEKSPMALLQDYIDGDRSKKFLIDLLVFDVTQRINHKALSDAVDIIVYHLTVEETDLRSVIISYMLYFLDCNNKKLLIDKICKSLSKSCRIKEIASSHFAGMEHTQREIDDTIRMLLFTTRIDMEDYDFLELLNIKRELLSGGF